VHYHFEEISSALGGLLFGLAWYVILAVGCDYKEDFLNMFRLKSRRGLKRKELHGKN